MPENERFEIGLRKRREVLGADYVERNLADADEFMMGFQRLVTEWAWGYAWSRPEADNPANNATHPELRSGHCRSASSPALISSNAIYLGGGFL